MRPLQQPPRRLGITRGGRRGGQAGQATRGGQRGGATRGQRGGATRGQRGGATRGQRGQRGGITQAYMQGNEAMFNTFQM